MKKNILSFILIVVFIFITGCASVPMESLEFSKEAKEFSLPPKDKAGLYIYRDSIVGAALKKTIWVDNQCLGTSAAEVFFYTEIDGDREVSIKTQSEFSPNELIVYLNNGKNHYVQQYIKIGLLVGGADLKLTTEEKGQEAISKLKLAKLGECYKESP